MPSRQPSAVSNADGDAIGSSSARASADGSGSVSKLVLGLALGGGFGALVLCLVFLWTLYQRLKASRTNPYDLAAVKQLRRYSYRQLKAATGTFGEAQRLGQGGFGTVYRGVLRPGQSIAVKKLDSSSLQGEREFQNEVFLIGRLHSPLIITLLGFCVEGKRRLLVYDFMPNRSLQEALFDDDYPVTLGWDMRFKIILDTAQGLAFLHFQCEPPIIHGDIKPSNILLDANFSARIADFGLARLKVETPAPDPGNEELEQEALERERIRFERAAREKVRRQRRREEVERKKAAAATAEQQDQVKLPGEPDAGDRISPKGTPIIDHPLFDDTRTEADTETVDLSTEDGKGEDERRSCYLRPGPKSEGVPSSGELSIRDYILEWRTNDSARRARSNGKDSSWRDDSSFELSREFTKEDRKKGQSRSSDGWVDFSGELIQEPLKTKEVGRREGREWWKDDHLGDGKSKLDKKERGKARARKHRREWWKDEYSGQLRSTRSRESGVDKKSKEWWNREDFTAEYSGKHRELRDARLKEKRREKSRSKNLGLREDHSGDLSQSADMRSSRRERTRSKDWLSGEATSRGVSSTPSMRGTICYVAPEYGGGGLLSEKSDVYSFGVLMLVIISGRRPLQVMASPIAELERANLISWARHLAQAGNVLDLVDTNFQGQFSKEQATLCIMVALLCLQRLPALRPAMPDVVKILLGQADLPALPFEFSPSPPIALASTPRSTEGIDVDLPLLS